MAFKYNKEYIKKNGRKLRTGGPRDLQRRQTQQSDVYEDLIEDLRKEISGLKKELQDDPVKKAGMFTAEQVDADINRVVNETIKELTAKHKNESEKKETAFLELSLKTKLKYNKIILEKETECKKLVATKEKLLTDLRDQNKSLVEKLCEIKESNDPEIANKLTISLIEAMEKMTLNVSVETDRPQMETVFIDPLEGDAGEGLEAHIDVEEVSIEQKENIQDKVSKLKNLLGGLKT
jgi:hypothetical protein